MTKPFKMRGWSAFTAGGQLGVGVEGKEIQQKILDLKQRAEDVGLTEQDWSDAKGNLSVIRRKVRELEGRNV